MRGAYASANAANANAYVRCRSHAYARARAAVAKVRKNCKARRMRCGGAPNAAWCRVRVRVARRASTVS